MSRSTTLIIALVGLLPLAASAQDVAIRTMAPPAANPTRMAINVMQPAIPAAKASIKAPVPAPSMTSATPAATPATSAQATAAPEFALTQPGVPGAVRDQAASLPVANPLPAPSAVTASGIPAQAAPSPSPTDAPPPPVFQTMKQAATAMEQPQAPAIREATPETKPEGWQYKAREVLERYKRWWPVPIAVFVLGMYALMRRRRHG